MAQTADYFGLTIDDLCGTSRTRVLVTARQIAMYLCRELTDLSLPKIGQQFGGRDHTTVMHADRKIRSLMAERRRSTTRSPNSPTASSNRPTTPDRVPARDRRHARGHVVAAGLRPAVNPLTSRLGRTVPAAPAAVHIPSCG